MYFTVFVGIIGVIISFVKSMKEVKTAIESPIKKLEDKLCQIDNKLIVMSNEDKLIKNSMLSLTRGSILEMCEKCLAKGEVTVEELDTLTHAVDTYKSLGGNSFVESLFDKVNKLPIK